MDNAIIEQKYKYSLVCPNCDVAFETDHHRKKFCTIACQKHFLHRTETKNCLHCNKEFKTRPEQLFCSKSCMTTYRHKTSNVKVLIETNKLKRIKGNALPIIYPMPILKEIAALLRIKRAKWQRSYESKLSGTKSYKKCPCCNKTFVYKVVNGCPPKYCNFCKKNVCQKNKIKNARIAKAKRRARIKGLRHEAIDPLFVFERDKWICHICKQKTYKRLRGSHNDKAPELDHIVTIAEGGSHTLENVACSCRSCNNKKSSKSFGQLFLFGG